MNNLNVNDQARDDVAPAKAAVIKPAAFAPADVTQVKAKRKRQPLLYVGAILLLIASAVLWYLFSAKSVVISTLPATEDITVSEGLYFELADHLLMLPGQYQINASLPGYYPLQQKFDVSEQQNQQIQFELTRLPGNLTLDITPAVDVAIAIDGAAVSFDGQQLKDIAAGKHQLTVANPRYFTQTLDVDIVGKGETQTLALALVPAWAEVSVNSEPEGAEVSIGAQQLGATPLSIELLQGQHVLTFHKQGYVDTEREIAVTAGQPLQLPAAKLIQNPGHLQLSTVPDGVSVTFGTQFLGKTPLSVAVTPDVTQPLMLFKEGFVRQQHNLNVPSGSTLSQSYTLKPVLGDIAFRVNPADALLYVDDHLLGRANQTLTLPVKNHHIRIESPGYVAVEKMVLPNPGLDQVVAVQLKTLEQAKWENMKPVITSAGGGRLKLFKPDDTFTMGASRREQGRRANEVQRTVTLNKPFYLGFTEVTNKEFKRFQQEHSSGNVKGNSLNGSNQPVVQVTWIQAAQFCNWLSQQDKLTPVYHIEDDKLLSFDDKATGYRLPTEAEWVWAARYSNGKMLKYAWGPQLPPTNGSVNIGDVSAASILGNIQASYNDNYVVSAPVASFPANEKGIFDLSGNVAEWIHDYYEIQTGLSLKADINPMGGNEGTFHLIRGASWAHGTRTELRLSFRDYGNDKRNDLGFRIARYAD